MSQGSPKKETEPEGFAAFLLWIWNPSRKEFLGRTGKSWFQVGVFYAIFFALLAVFFAIMLKVFMVTISYERPKWAMEDSLIGLSPGLSYRPSARAKKIDSTLIQFRPGRNESYFPWVKNINDFLAPYREAYRKYGSSCTQPTRKLGCPFVLDVDGHSCGPNFGYDTGSPCVLIKLNRVFNWKPSPYRSLDEIRNGNRKNVNGNKPLTFEASISNTNDITSGEGQISIQCEGEHALDKEKLSTISYWPRQGFPAEYYPYTNQKDYLSPFVLVKFKAPTRGSVINVDCIAMDRNIKINRHTHEGATAFQLLIDY